MSEVEKKESRLEQWTEVAGLLAAIVSLIGLAYVVVNDRIDAFNLASSRRNDLAVIRVLESDVSKSFSKSEIQRASDLDTDDTSEAVTRLVTDGLVAIRADGSYKLATTEFLEISSQLERSNVALNEQIQEIQNEVKKLEEQRNQLMAAGNETQGLIAGLHTNHYELRASTNNIANEMAVLMERNNNLIQLNVNQLRQALRNVSKYATAIYLIQNEVVKVEPNELAAINNLFIGVLDPESVPEIYSIVHKYFPQDFDKPSDAPWSRMDTPEMLMFDAISGTGSTE